MALKDAAAAVQLDPTFGKAYLRIAGCNMVFGDFEAAEQNLRLAAQHMDEKGAIEVQKEQARREKVCKFISDFEKCWSKEDWRSAVYFATQVIDAAPKMHSMVTRKAEALVYNKKVDEAMNLMADVLRMDDKNVDAIFVRGKLSLSLSDVVITDAFLIGWTRSLFLSPGQLRQSVRSFQTCSATVT